MPSYYFIKNNIFDLVSDTMLNVFGKKHYHPHSNRDKQNNYNSQYFQNCHSQRNIIHITHLTNFFATCKQTFYCCILRVTPFLTSSCCILSEQPIRLLLTHFKDFGEDSISLCLWIDWHVAVFWVLWDKFFSGGQLLE